MPTIMWMFLYIGIFIHAIFSHLSTYWYWRWIDMPVHFLGGLWLGLAGIYLYRKIFPQTFSRRKNLFFFVIALSTTLVIGGLWEITEISLGSLKIVRINSVKDTLGDLFFDLLGACVGAIYFILRRQKTLTR